MNSNCIEWSGALNRTGYGKVPWSAKNANGRPTLAHRWAYEKFHGLIPSGLSVLHTCDNPPCINPLHLRVGTAKDNLREASLKGRMANQRKTSCPRGHSFTPKNTYIRPDSGSRVCRQCVIRHTKERRARRRAELVSQ